MAHQGRRQAWQVQRACRTKAGGCSNGLATCNARHACGRGAALACKYKLRQQAWRSACLCLQPYIRAAMGILKASPALLELC